MSEDGLDRAAAQAELEATVPDATGAPAAGSRRKRKRRRETNFEAAQRIQRDNMRHRLSHVRMVAAVDSGTANLSFTNGVTWPTSCDTACWHCCHTFKWPPVGMPVKHYPATDHLVLQGTFCSLNCCKAHMRAEQGPTRQSDMLLEMLALRIKKQLRLAGEDIPRHMCIRPSPPRTALGMFGGFMTIEEFRGNVLTVERVASMEPFKKVTWEGVKAAVRGVTVQHGAIEQAFKQQQRQQPAQNPESTTAPAPAPIKIPPRVPKHRHRTLDCFVKKRT